MLSIFIILVFIATDNMLPWFSFVWYYASGIQCPYNVWFRITIKLLQPSILVNILDEQFYIESIVIYAYKFDMIEYRR